MNKIIAVLSVIPMWLTAILGALQITTGPLMQLLVWAVGITLNTWAAMWLWRLSAATLDRSVAALVLIIMWGGLLAGTFIGELSNTTYVILGIAGLLFITLNGVLLYRAR